VEKVTMPGKKNVFRLYSNDGHALIDLMQLPDELPPEVNKRVLCRHPFQVISGQMSWGRCYDHKFLLFFPIFVEKIGVFS
jgi:hypothetical protein